MSQNKDITRRNFLKMMGLGATATAAAMAGCSTENHAMQLHRRRLKVR